VCPVGIPQHIIQRGNNHQACFATEKDFITYTAYLKKYAELFDVSIHAWVFMTNHVHLLCTPT
jgi:putative transposase